MYLGIIVSIWLSLQHEAGGGEDWQQDIDMVSDILIYHTTSLDSSEVSIVENSFVIIGQAQDLG